MSSLCDKLVSVLNHKCVDDIANHTIVFPLTGTLNSLNSGQGLGFRVFGIVVDNKMLFRTGTAIATVFATGIPLIIELRPDINEEFAQNSTSVCATTCDRHLEEEMKRMLASHERGIAHMTALLLNCTT